MAALPDNIPDTEALRINGPVLRFAMRAHDMSNAGLAGVLDVHEATVSRLLGGDPTSARVVRKILATFPRLTLGEVVDMDDLAARMAR